MKVGIAVAGVVIAVLGIGVIVMQNDGGSGGVKANAPTSSPLNAEATGGPAKPTPQEVQSVIAGITAQVLAPANTAVSTEPLTKAEVEALVRDQLRKLGIEF